MTEYDINGELESLRDRKRSKPAKPDSGAAAPEAPAAEPVEEPSIYVVNKGDSLSKIAQEVYGNSGRWREIYDANRDRIDEPNLIRPGWKLRIP